MTSSEVIVIFIWLRGLVGLIALTANVMLARVYQMDLSLITRTGVNGSQKMVLKNRVYGAQLRTYGLVVLGISAFVGWNGITWSDPTPRNPRAIEEVLLFSIVARDCAVILQQWLEREALARMGQDALDHNASEAPKGAKGDG